MALRVSLSILDCAIALKLIPNRASSAPLYFKTFLDIDTSLLSEFSRSWLWKHDQTEKELLRNQHNQLDLNLKK